jgi:hypothetical protein
MAERKTDDEWFTTPEGRANAAWDLVREIRKDAREEADKGENAGKVFPYTQRLFDADRYSMSMLLHHVFEWFASAREKREALEARVAELEKAPTTYRGVYEEGATYEAKSIVSHGGSMWHTATKTKAKPGEGPPWQLCVKRGQDGKGKP